MLPAYRTKPAGFTLYEFAVSAAVLGALVGALLLRAASYRQQADEVAVQQVVSTLRMALALRATEVAAREGERGLRRLAEENPFDWLAAKPRNYLGEYYSPDTKEIPAGNWLFDRRDKCLVYLINDHKSFSLQASNLLKFKVEFAPLPRDNGKTGNRPAEAATGVVLVQVNGSPPGSRDQ